MLTRLRLLQSKYSLSDQELSDMIRAEIIRQASLDISGVINNCSIALLDSLVGEFTTVAPATPLLDSEFNPALQLTLDDTTSVHTHSLEKLSEDTKCSQHQHKKSRRK